MMPIMRPEKVNGQTIMKPYVRGGDGIMQRLESQSVMFPPGVRVDHPILSIDEMMRRALDDIARNGMCTKSELKGHLYRWLNKAALNERRKCVLQLRSHGLDMASQAIERLPKQE